MQKLKMHSPDMTQENIARIRELFPHCVTEAHDENDNVALRVDFDLLRQELSNVLVEGGQERYRLDWPGKRQALLSFTADSTMLSNPTVLNANLQKGSGGGVPVGTVITWPAGSNPEDAEDWLECNGQSISAKAYPELAAIVGSTVPDYQGMFLRGHGGNSAAIGVRQSDGLNASVPFQFEMSAKELEMTSSSFGDKSSMLDARLGWSAEAATIRVLSSTHYSERDFSWKPWGTTTTIDARIKSDSPETRPVNMAVRYLIKAR